MRTFCYRAKNALGMPVYSIYAHYIGLCNEMRYSECIVTYAILYRPTVRHFVFRRNRSAIFRSNIETIEITAIYCLFCARFQVTSEAVFVGIATYIFIIVKQGKMAPTSLIYHRINRYDGAYRLLRAIVYMISFVGNQYWMYCSSEKESRQLYHELFRVGNNPTKHLERTNSLTSNNIKICVKNVMDSNKYVLNRSVVSR